MMTLGKEMTHGNGKTLGKEVDGTTVGKEVDGTTVGKEVDPG